MGFDELTGRERAVAEAARSGASSRAIADQLFLSRRTVETHLGSIYRKLAVTTRGELIALLHSLAPVAATVALPAVPPLLVAADTFVGREMELQVITDAVRTAQTGAAASVMIGGEPGIGKSALVARAAAHAHAAGSIVLAGRCDRDFPAPFAPIADALRPLLRSNPELAHSAGPGLGALRAIIPEHADQLPATPAVEDAATARRLLIDAIRALLRAGGAATGLLLIIEDLQWADQATVSLIGRLVSAHDVPSLALVATFRNTELFGGHPLPALLADCWRERSVRRVDLGGLAPDEVTRLAHRAGAPAMTSAELDRLQARTDGNPFFVLQLTDRGQAQPGPGSVREVVLHRAGELGSDTVRVLQTAAVLGNEIDPAFVVEVIGELGGSAAAAAESVESALTAACRARLLTALPGSPRFRFTHDLVREALDNELNAIARARLHAAAGRALLTVYAGDLEPHQVALATHFAAAAPLGEGVRAAEHSLAAARQSVARLSPDDALEFAALGLRHLPAGREHDALRLELVLVEVDAHGTRMDLPAHRAATFRAVDIARRIGDPVALARAVDRNTVLPVMGTLDEELLTVKQQAIDALGGAPSPLRTRLLVSAAYQRAIGGHGWAAAEQAELAIADGRLLDDTDSIVGGLYALASAAMGRPDVGAQLAVADELTELGGSRVDLVPERDGRRFRGILRLASGDRDGFESDLDELARFGERSGSVWVRSLVAEWRVMSALLDADLDEAETLANAVLAVSGDDPNFLLGWFVQLADIRIRQGRAAEMVPLAAATLAEHRDLHVVRALAANLQVAAGEQDAARELLLPLVAAGWASLATDWLRPAALGYLAPPVRATQDAATCLALAEQLAPYSGQLLIVGAGALVVGSADHARATLLAAAGTQHRAESVALFHAAIQLAETVRAPTLAARSCDALAALG